MTKLEGRRENEDSFWVNDEGNPNDEARMELRFRH